MLNTQWEIRTYDVWGNAKDGYDVNNVFVVHRKYDLAIPVSTYNIGTPQQFSSASPTDKQIKEALGLSPNMRIDTDGDDLTIYVNRERDSYPLGELHCISHDSLSPIRAKVV